MKLVLFLAFLISCTFQLQADRLPLIEKCDYTKDLFDDGNYLKTACVVHESVEYERAIGKCAEYNMNLFVLDNEIERSHLLDAAQEAYPKEKFGLWVNGMRHSGSKDWYTVRMFGHKTDDILLSNNISFYSNHEPGNCLRISTKYTGIYGVLPGICNEKSFLVCEHNVQTQKPPELDISRCFFHQDLFSKKNGRYIKSVCFSNEVSIYDQARRRCAGYGMNLFIFDSEETDESFFEVTSDLLNSFPGGHFWINGVRNPQNNEWNTYYANRVIKGPVYNGLEWVNLKRTHGISSGDFLLISGQFGPYQSFGGNDDFKCFIICEYSNL